VNQMKILPAPFIRMGYKNLILIAVHCSKMLRLQIMAN